MSARSTPAMSAAVGSGPGRRRWFRLLALLGPVVLLLSLEAALRLAGYGYSPAFFKPLQRGADRFLVENDRFGWRFFPPAVARSEALANQRDTARNRRLPDDGSSSTATLVTGAGDTG